ncbi:MAG: hypothetical protein WC813_02170 [Patescibacteria group bacterium]|jgi:hypothetical protein
MIVFTVTLEVPMLPFSAFVLSTLIVVTALIDFFLPRSTCFREYVIAIRVALLVLSVFTVAIGGLTKEQIYFTISYSAILGGNLLSLATGIYSWVQPHEKSAPNGRKSVPDGKNVFEPPGSDS